MLTTDMEHMLKSILKAYDRTEVSFEEDVTKLKEWIKSQPHLPEIMDNSRIKNFLLLNKCTIERTKQKIDNYYTMRTLLPEFFVHPKCEQIQKARAIVNVVSLPKLTKDMSRVFFIQIRESELINEIEPQLSIVRLFHLQEIRLEEDLMFTNVIVLDLKGSNLEHTLKMTPTLLKKTFTILEIHVYENSDILHEVFPKEMTPRDYGGEEKSLDELSELQSVKFETYEARFDKLAKMKTDENLRPVPLKNDEMLGFPGNFKKLEVD